MDRIAERVMVVARILFVVVFLLNGFGVIDQNIPAREMAERGVPASIVPFAMMAGRLLQVVAGIGMAVGIYPRICAAALGMFLIPATLISHSFWLAHGTPSFQAQLINFSKNLALIAGLFFIAATSTQPGWVSKSILRTQSLPGTD